MDTVRIFAKLDYKSKDGTVPLYLRLTQNRKVHPPLNLGLRIDPAYWIQDTATVRPSHPLAQKLNLLLSRTLTRAQEILLDHALRERVLTYDNFVKEFSGLSPYDFYLVVDEYLSMNKGIFSFEYREKVRHVTNKLREFAPALELHQVDYDFIKRYTQHLATTRNNSKNTIHSNLRIIRRVFSEAVRRDLIKKNPFDGYRLEKMKTTRDILDVQEIQALEDLIHSSSLAPHLKKTLAWFLLAIYTGRRYQDLQHFNEWKFTESAVSIVQQKRVRGRDERKVITVYLNENIRRICELIRKENYGALSNTMANKFLKEITSLAAIEKHITFHGARHTFATLNKKLTEDLTVRRDLLGQDSINSTLIYDHVDPARLTEVMKGWEKLLPDRRAGQLKETA